MSSRLILAPTGSGGSVARPLAARRSIETADVLLIDNGQLAVERTTYGPILDWIADDLRARFPAIAIHREHADLVTFPRSRLATLRDSVVARGVRAVVIAVCHAGVTAPSSLLASDLEALGIATVLLCTPLGLPLARVTTDHRAPGLPLVPVRLTRGFSAAELASYRAELADAVVGALDGTRPDTSGPRDVRVELPAEIDLPGSESLDAAAYAFFDELRIGDGLPVVAPTPPRVDAMLAATRRGASEQLIPECPPSGVPLSVRDAAINAVLAGCEARHFPFVIAALDAMSDDRYRLLQAAISTHPGGNAVIVSGPLAAPRGLHGGPGAFGPGSRANVTIGRAVSLAVANVGRIVPGRSGLATHGSAAQITYCAAEDIASSPWPGLHTELAGPEDTTVTVMKIESPHNVISNRGPGTEALLTCMADVLATTGNNGTRWPCEHLVVLNPAQARAAAAAGWDRARVRQYLFEKARVPVTAYDPTLYAHARPAWMNALAETPVVERPDQLVLIVAGGIGNQAVVGLPWGLSAAISRVVEAA